MAREDLHGLVVVKLGGSAITDKSRICTPRLDLIHRAAGEIAAYSKQSILLHGGGSYAHPFATKERVASGFKGRNQLKSVSEIELNLDQLTRIIGVALLLRGRPFVPIHPLSFMTLRNGAVHASFLRPIVASLGLGMIPIIHGDVAVDEGRGFGIISADRIASLLGRKLPVSRVLFGCDVDGVYEDPKNRDVVERVDRGNYRSIVGGLKRSLADATGGMRGKVDEALRLAKDGVESYIFNLNKPGYLTSLLNGDSSIGTRFVPWR